jgi:hypothetical protein
LTLLRTKYPAGVSLSKFGIEVNPQTGKRMYTHVAGLKDWLSGMPEVSVSGAKGWEYVNLRGTLSADGNFDAQTVADVNAIDQRGYRPLHNAARHDQADEVERLLRAGADPAMRNIRGSTPAHTAAGWGSLRALRCLVVFGGADVNARGPNDMTALDYALINHRRECAEFLRTVGGISTQKSMK